MWYLYSVDFNMPNYESTGLGSILSRVVSTTDPINGYLGKPGNPDVTHLPSVPGYPGGLSSTTTLRANDMEVRFEATMQFCTCPNFITQTEILITWTVCRSAS